MSQTILVIIKNQSPLAGLMRTCIDRLIAQAHLDASRVRGEATYISNRLEQARSEELISNEAFLDAGAIEGALEMIANHLDMGISQSEVHDLLRDQLERAKRIEEKHPGLNQVIENGRD